MNYKTFAAKFFHGALLLALGLFLSATNARADWGDHRQLRDEIDQLRAFLQKHPTVSTEIQNNPQLVYNNRYLAKHEEVENFLRRHPLVRREISENPGRVFGRYYGPEPRYGFNVPWGWAWGR